MGSQAHDYPASDDSWIKAAGFDPSVYPAIVMLSEYIGKCDIPPDTLKQMESDGWMDVSRRYTLEERFGLFGVKIVQSEYGCNMFNSYEPRILTISNGIVLKEVRDLESESDMLEDDPDYAGCKRYKQETELTIGYDFVFKYKVVKVT